MKTSTDLFFCAYLQMLGIKIKSYNVLDRGRVQCMFDLGDEDWKNHKVNFNNSDFAKLKQYIEQIKDLSY